MPLWARLCRNVKYNELVEKLWKELRVMEPLDSWCVVEWRRASCLFPG